MNNALSKDVKGEDLRKKVVNVWLKAWEMSDCDKIETSSAWPLLIAAAILHDVDKIVEFYETTGRLTSCGQLFDHTSIAISLALEQALPLEIIHAIGTHSPIYSKHPPNTMRH